MGQTQSSEKPSSSRSNTPQAEKERKVHRRISVAALSQTRAGPVDASATREVAQGTTTHNLQQPNLHQMLQSTSPELTNKSAQVSRSISQNSRGRKEEDHRLPPLTTAQPSGGINIPTTHTPVVRSRQEELQGDHRVYQEPQYAPVSHHRPPRLPLPIAELTTPESPTLAPVDRGNADVPIFETDDAIVPAPGSMHRKSSMLSVTTQDEDDVGEELQPYGVGLTGQTVPTVIEWNRPAERVFVTGTFAAWDKKYRLRKSESHEGRFKTTINLPPGTHHLKFFVDNQMVTSDDLPTAVDFNNILVNYLEISTDDLPKSRRESSQPQPKGVSVPSVPQQPPRESRDEEYSGTATPGDEEEEGQEPPIEEMPEGDFRQLIPQSLTDIDMSEDDPRYKQAAQVIQDSPAPPSLPLFLSRSILNGNLPVKDDSSVLALPNHTVLNHLMTSSVRNGVLATSVTTRYKKKYVTTISFKPVPRAAAA